MLNLTTLCHAGQHIAGAYTATQDSNRFSPKAARNRWTHDTNVSICFHDREYQQYYNESWAILFLRI